MTNYTDITILLDRSGSMDLIRDATLEGLNAFIRDQQAQDGIARISLIQFDDKYELNFVDVPIKDLPYLTRADYEPRGMTALLDSLARAMNETGQRLASMKEKYRPSRVVFVVVTDGQENASTQYKYEQVREMIKHQEEKYSWDIIFLGANINVEREQALLGMRSALSYKANDIGVRGAFASASMGVRAARKGIRDIGAVYFEGSLNSKIQSDVVSAFDLKDEDLAVATEASFPEKRVK